MGQRVSFRHAVACPTPGQVGRSPAVNQETSSNLAEAAHRPAAGVLMKHTMIPESEGTAARNPGNTRIRQPTLAQRVDARQALGVQAMVSIAGLTSRPFELNEISRGGMFLAFRDAQSTWLEFHQEGVEPGAGVEVAFTVSLPDNRHRFSVTGEIARITRQGIGVRFATHNPPQLAALRELFNQASEGDGGAATDAGTPSDRPQRQVLDRPSEDRDWKDWTLVE